MSQPKKGDAAVPAAASAAGKAEFESLDFPGRTSLYPQECAKKLSCSTDHLVNLIKSGELGKPIPSAKKSLRSYACVSIQGWRQFIRNRTTGRTPGK